MDRSTEDLGVLYEVVISSEWDAADVTPTTADRKDRLEADAASNVPYPWIAKLLFPILWIYSWISWRLSEGIAKLSIPDTWVAFLSSGIPWRLTVSPFTETGTTNICVLAAVITEDSVEIRHSTDEFATSREKFSLRRNQYPMLRQVVWSADGSCMALADSSGDLTLYDRLNADSRTLKVSKPWLESSRLLRQRVISNLLWLESSSGDEGVMLCYADATCTFLGKNDEGMLAESWKVNCRTTLPRLMKGISSAAYARNQNIIVVASTICTRVDEDLNNPWFAGLSLWMVADEAPFLRPVNDDNMNEAQRARGLYKRFAKAADGAIKMAFNEDETELVTLFLSGAVAVWQVSFRCIKLRRIWTVDELPRYSQTTRSPGKARARTDFRHPDFPVDVQWWSNTAIILCQAGGAVSLLDITGRELVNISHGSFEQFSPGCLITPNLAEKFLILEQNSTGKNWQRNVSVEEASMTGDDIGLLSEDDDNAAVSAITEVLQSFGMANDKPVKALQKKKVGNSYRLNCFQTASPQEMFTRKLAEEQYGEALVLAERFHLDTDLVYQKRWMKSKVTKISITDFLCKVTNAAWVLRECLTRVPDNPDVARELLMVGLRLTDFTSISRLNDNGTSGGGGDGFHPSDSGDLQLTLDASTLTPEQHAMIGHRRQLLRFENILSTYEQILGGGEKAVRYFLAEEYTEMRRKPPLGIALQYAHKCKPLELHTLRYLHHAELADYWLDILSGFPETCPPEGYQFLVPSILNGEVLDTQHAAPRVLDWCWKGSFSDVSDQESLAVKENLEALQATLTYRGKLTAEKLQRWAENRIREIEHNCGLIENAKQMLQVATAKQVEGLDGLRDELDTLSALVFDGGQTSLSLFDLRLLSNRQILELLDDKKNFPAAFRSRMLPFLRRCERKQPGTQHQLLDEYLSKLSTDPQETLDKCLKVFQQSLPGLPEPAIPSPGEAVELAIKCILGCPRTDQLDQMKAILQCLPSRESMPNGDAAMFQKVTRIQDLIMCVEFAEQFGVQLSVKNLRDVQANETLVVEFVSHILQVAAQKVPGFTELEWRDIYGRYVKICKRVFLSISDATVVQLFTSALLSAGKNQYIDLAAKFFPIQPTSAPSIIPRAIPGDSGWIVHNRLSTDISSKQLLSAAKEYFINADNWKDPKIKLAEKCLELESSLKTAAGTGKLESGLVDALKVLHALGVDASPLDLWTSEDRFKFVQQVLDVKVEAYRHPDRLRELSKMLDLKDLNRVTEAVAEKAFERRDYGFCRDLCETLIEEKRSSSWELCMKLAAAEDFTDIAFKENMLLVAVANCPDDNLTDLAKLRNRISLQRIRSTQQFSPKLDASVEPIAKLILDPCCSSVHPSSSTKTQPLAKTEKRLELLSAISDPIRGSGLEVLVDGEHRSGSSAFIDGVLVDTALSYLDVDVGLSLASLGALTVKSTAEKFFDAVPPTAIIARLAAYFYGLEVVLRESPDSIENALNLSCHDLLARAPRVSTKNTTTVQLLDLFSKYAQTFSSRKASATGTTSVTSVHLKRPPPSTPSAATSAATVVTSIRSLLKGVDEKKFHANAEYRKSFLLRAAATRDPTFLHRIVDAAEEHGVDGWEVVAANIKFLFTTSGMSVTEVETFLGVIPDLIARLKARRVDFISFSGLQIQSHMTKADIDMLVAYSDFLTDIKKT
ncbi:Neuroblastoma-amplified sequence [Hypsibius exemplaris]|uniref:Neuroblastoma-amplified sequence n=1 Tax=Hypsibius exemplaris TaxID=2072580 RepID=A0A1W0XB69_HYPEX|nr:Neuroblastoma-amplified sequence [Hypsibius exemplaris]